MGIYNADGVIYSLMPAELDVRGIMSLQFRSTENSGFDFLFPSKAKGLLHLVDKPEVRILHHLLKFGDGSIRSLVPVLFFDLRQRVSGIKLAILFQGGKRVIESAFV